MKFFIQKTRDKKEKIFLFQYNRYQNGFGDIYFRLWKFHLLIYTYKIIGKMKEGTRKHKTVKF
mgnify:CR=1 FL=1